MFKILKARWSFQVDKNSELAFKLLDESLEMSKSLKNIDGEMLAEAFKRIHTGGRREHRTGNAAAR